MLNFSTEQSRIILLALTELYDNGPNDPDFGICRNLNNNFSSSGAYGGMGYVVVGTYSPTWRHYSGSDEYPVPKPELGQYGKLWEGKQLDYRLSLIRHIFKEVSCI